MYTSPSLYTLLCRMKGVHGVCIRMHVRTNMYVCTNALMTVCTTTTTTTGRVPEEVPLLGSSPDHGSGPIWKCKEADKVNVIECARVDYIGNQRDIPSDITYSGVYHYHYMYAHMHPYMYVYVCIPIHPTI